MLADTFLLGGNVLKSIKLRPIWISTFLTPAVLFRNNAASPTIRKSTLTIRSIPTLGLMTNSPFCISNELLIVTGSVIVMACAPLLLEILTS